MNKEKMVIYLAGDSTMQTYGEEKRPQAGWGEYLLKYLDRDLLYEIHHRSDCVFEQERYYESSLIVDNCAMAGRSSKTFLEEGRLLDISHHIKQGDYLFIQFGHNDASTSKKERYVPLEQFEGYLRNYVEAALTCGAVPVLISSIALRPCRENEEGEKGEIKRNLRSYAEVMENYAVMENIAYVDMGEITGEYCRQAGEEKTRTLYKEDHVHLTEAGADLYAKLFMDRITGSKIINQI